MTKIHTQNDNPAPQEGATRRSGAKSYEGSPCKNCGGTLRGRCDRSCVECKRARTREWRKQNSADPDWVAHRRETKARWLREKRASDPGYDERVQEGKNRRARERYANDPEYAARERKRYHEKKASDPAWFERRRESSRQRYENLDHVEYYGWLLKARRRKALKRMEERHNGSLSDEG